ncbi:hypothetical protein ACFPER_05300 [Agromyces aurantiacus]|uniref:Transcriptional regulator, AbiEi antitoxin, Type IV TA system n=1 Tax=Agromyces aurantiacus TaxID=165814 RepID=A0ABV9R4L8_9MICO|nr:hypothetical protein [Agromyces aurantiacus]MBM7502877.1 hypothetical protein [Agromyces aurantiacus]
MPRLILTSTERLSPSGDRWLQRAVQAGRLVRVRAGHHVDAVEWDAASHDQRALLRVAAGIRTRRQSAVLTHESAALVLGIPIIGARPDAVHLVSSTGSAPRNERGVVWHRERLRDGDVIAYGGFFVTSPERTMYDLARTRGFASAVTGLDAALAGRYEPLATRFDGEGFVQWTPEPIAALDREALTERIDASGGARGIRSARRAVEFADPRSASSGESLSRAQIHLLGFPQPEVQVAFARLDGGVDVVDFIWRDLLIAGEFDGFVKYHREDYLDGRTPEEVVWLEKQRERRLRRDHGLEVSRWSWDAARTPSLLRAELIAAGLQPVRR